MIVQIVGGCIISVMTISDEKRRVMFLAENPSFIETSFVFNEALDLYEYVDGGFQLINNWQEIKAQREAESANSSIDESGLVVPNSITKRQGRQQMILMGLLSNVQAAIDAIPDETERLLAQSFWDDSTQYERNHLQMIQLAQAMGLTDEQLDQAFIAAAQL